MVTHKLVDRLNDAPQRQPYSWPMKLADVLLGLLVLAIMGTAVYMGSKPSPPPNGCDHVSHLAGRCHE